MNMKPTIKDVARLANVSITTVSNVLNGNFNNMSEETRRRVEKVIEELNYYPSVGARSLPRKGKTQSICIVIPHNMDYIFNHRYFAGVMKGIAEVVEMNGYRTLLLATRDKRKSEINYLKGLKSGIVDGFLLFDINQNDPYVEEFLSSNIPFMVVGQYKEGDGNYVDIDVVNGSYQAVHHLIEHGYRKIFLIAGPKTMVFTQQIVKGYKKALHEFGMKYSSKNVFYGPFSVKHGYEAGQKILQMLESRSAVFSTSEQATLGLSQLLNEKGLAFPDDVGIISFGENRSLGTLSEILTSIKQPEYEIGKKVMEKLINMIKTNTYVTTAEILPVKLDVRKSCGCNK